MKLHLVKKLWGSLSSLSLMTLLISFTLLTASCRQDKRAEAAFAEMVGRAANSGITLKTKYTTYRQGEEILFWVENQTDYDLWFINDNFGVRGWSYDPTESRWKEVDLGNRIINPKPWKMPARHLLYGNLGHLNTSFFTQIGRIRLVVYGCLILERLDENCADYVAYRDITIKPRR